VADRTPTTTHTEHDLLLVAALADRELDGEEAERGRAQVAACTECAALHAELVSLATATRALPPVSRPRDFRLRPADAERLRPNLVRRILGSFGTARDGFSRPLAMGLTTLGLAGLLIGVVPGALPAGGAGGAGAAATQLRLEAGAPDASPGIDTSGEAPGQAQGAESYGRPTMADRDAATTIDAGDLLVPISGGLLLAGLGIGFARRMADRSQGNHRGRRAV
jgi:anti-sigma factor RsiW